MRMIWNIRLDEMASGWRVVITGDGQKVTGHGPTPYRAYRSAEIQLVIMPAFFLDPGESLSDELVSQEQR